jgi:hypothetical protein
MEICDRIGPNIILVGSITKLRKAKKKAASVIAHEV